MNNKTNKLIPELRFPEFVNDGEWVEKSLEEMANIVASGDLDTESFSSEPTDAHIYPIYSNSISNKGLYGYNTHSKYKRNSVTITARGTLGVAFYRDAEFVGIGRLLVVSDFKNVNPVFFKENWNHYAKIPIENGGIPQLTAIKAKSITLLYPNPSEQQKIASCLSSLDKVIAAHSQKLEALKAHKKGLMQNLFPTNSIANYELKITNVPNYRFSEFVGDGEWVENELGEVTLKVGSGSTPLGGESVYKKNGRPFVRSQNIGWGIFLIENIAFIDEETHKNSINTEIEIEDVLLNITGASIGRSVVANQQVSGGNVNQHVCIIRTKRKYLNPFFLCQYIISAFGQKQIDSFQAGGNRQGLNFAQIRSLSIPIPPNLKEQQKIATCLSSLDDLIIAQAAKIEQLKLHKKGLMQGLFPSTTNKN